MGNCATSKTIQAVQDEKIELPREAKTTEKSALVGGSSTLQPEKNVERKKEKRVRFRLHGEDSNAGGNFRAETKSGVVRIRVVLTQKALDQILNGEIKHSSAEQFLTAIKLRSKSISLARSNDGEMNGNWRPALESILEDHY